MVGEPLLSPSLIEALWVMAIAVTLIAAVIAAIRWGDPRVRTGLLLSGITVMVFLFVVMIGLSAAAMVLGHRLEGPFPWFAIPGASVIAWPVALRRLARMPRRDAFLLGVSLAPMTVVLQVLIMLAIRALWD